MESVLLWWILAILFLLEGNRAEECAEGWCEMMGYVGTAGNSTVDGQCEGDAQPLMGCCCLNMLPTSSTTASSSSSSSTTPSTSTTTLMTCTEGWCELMGYAATIGSTRPDGTCGGGTVPLMGCCCMSEVTTPSTTPSTSTSTPTSTSTSTTTPSTTTQFIPWLYVNGRRSRQCKDSLGQTICQTATSHGLCLRLTKAMAYNCCWSCWSAVPNFLPYVANMGRGKRDAPLVAIGGGE